MRKQHLVTSLTTACFLVCLGSITSDLAAQEERLLKRPFGSLDKNKDGFIAKDEFPGNPALFAAMDKSKDKKVDFDEYKVSTLAKRYLAALRVNRSEPRARVSAADLAPRRLAVLSRFDSNRDGKITRQEWSGAPAAFDTLDIDRNGVIDKKDQRMAKGEAEALAVSQDQMPRVTSKLPSAEKALMYYDKNKDAFLTEKEVAKTPFARFFSWGDRNGDKALDNRELNGVVGMVNAAVASKNKGYAKPRAPSIPFKAWDKDNDGRLNLKEFVGQKYLFKQMDINRDAAVTELEVLRFKRSFEGSDFLSKFDLDKNGKVTPKEFGGTAAAFARADRNGDGVISKRDR